MSRSNVVRELDPEHVGPALTHRGEGFPWPGRIPLRVRMVKRVWPDFPFLLQGPVCAAEMGQEYDTWTNVYGAVAVWVNGEKLGVRPDEFQVVEWYTVEVESG